MALSDTPTEQRSWPRRLLNRLEIGQAVFFAVVLRGWQLAAGVVTVFLMTLHFSQEVQGFYYTFLSLIALQSFFELGLSIAIISICSHEWERLQLASDGRITGDPASLSRLVSFGRQLIRWYGRASVLFVVVVSVAGTWLLGRQAADGIDWKPPWFTLVMVSGLLLCTLPFNSMLEGCNQVVAINRFRLIQAISVNICVWTAMMVGGGLWAAVGAASARVVTEVGLLIWYRRFFAPFWHESDGERIDWKAEVLPLQWRLAIGAVFGYFAWSLLCPVMFAYHGPIVAGQMGLTWTVVTTAQGAALAWVQTRVPLFGMLIKRRDRAELDRVFFRVGAMGVAAYLLAATTFWLIAWNLSGFRQWDWITQRILPVTPTAFLLAAAFVQMVVSYMSFYVRAHKQEPYLLVGTISNISIALAVWQLGMHYSATGAAVGLLVANAVVTLPTHYWLWAETRKQPL